MANLTSQCRQSKPYPNVNGNFTALSYAQEAEGSIADEQLQGHRLSEDANAIQLVIVNGHISSVSRLGQLPDGVYIGSIKDAPAAVASQLVGLPSSRPR